MTKNADYVESVKSLNKQTATTITTTATHRQQQTLGKEEGFCFPDLPYYLKCPLFYKKLWNW